MNQEAVTALAGKLFKLLLESELSEAEVVKALSTGCLMRLAYDTDTPEELLMKIDALCALFKTHARNDLQAFMAAREAGKVIQ